MPVGLRAGSLNRRLRLQRVVMTSDSEGTSSELWTDVATIWADINPAGGREIYLAGQTEEKITYSITIRWRSDVTPKMRFLYLEPTGQPTRFFLIHSMIDMDQLRRELTCGCEEIVTVAIGAD